MTEGSSRRRILVVEDDPSVVRRLDLILTQAGYDVIVARNGFEGIRLWRDLGADVLLLDILMPEKDGLETIIAILAHDPRVRIVAMSGGLSNQRIDLLGDAKMVGALLTLAKPFTPAEVLAVVHRALEWSGPDPQS